MASDKNAERQEMEIEDKVDLSKAENELDFKGQFEHWLLRRDATVVLAVITFTGFP